MSWVNWSESFSYFLVGSIFRIFHKYLLTFSSVEKGVDGQGSMRRIHICWEWWSFRSVIHHAIKQTPNNWRYYSMLRFCPQLHLEKMYSSQRESPRLVEIQPIIAHGTGIFIVCDINYSECTNQGLKRAFDWCKQFD